jgi:hypothetical protein
VAGFDRGRARSTVVTGLTAERGVGSASWNIGLTVLHAVQASWCWRVIARSRSRRRRAVEQVASVTTQLDEARRPLDRTTGDGDGRVAELLLDDLGVDAGFERQRRPRVPSVVEPDLRDAGALHRVLDHLGEPMRVLLDASFIDEDVPAVVHAGHEAESFTSSRT